MPAMAEIKAQPIIRTPLLLNVLAIIWTMGAAIGTVAGVLENSALGIAWGIGGTIGGIGLLLGKRWGWWTIVVLSGLDWLIGLGSILLLLVLPQMRHLLGEMESFLRTAMISLFMATWLFQVFMFLYLLGPRHRILFGIGGLKQR